MDGGGGTAALSIAGLSKTKGVVGQSSFTLRAPELNLRAGALTAIVGDSGCGKTTLLDIMALISEPTACARFDLARRGDAPVDVRRLHLERREADLAAQRAAIGYVLQAGGLLPFLSVFDNAATPFRIRRQPVDGERIEALARRLGIHGQLRMSPAALSGGQRQRAAILRALAHRPAIIFADEPTAAVDKDRAIEIMNDLEALARDEGISVAVVTHDQDLVRARADAAYGFTVTADGEDVTSVCAPVPLAAVARHVGVA